jgi:hypothetical protein
VNFCGIFVGVVYVYGKHQQGDEAALLVTSYVDQILDTTKPQDIHSELVALHIVDYYSSIDAQGGGSNSSSSQTNDDSGGLSRLGILLVVIACLLFLAITYYIYIQWRERQVSDTMFSSRQNSNRRQWNKVFKRHQQSHYKDYDPEQKSIRSSLEAVEEFEEEFDEFGYDDDQHIGIAQSDSKSNGRSDASKRSTSRSDRSKRTNGRTSAGSSSRFSSSHDEASNSVLMSSKDRGSRATSDCLEGLRFDSYDGDNDRESTKSASVGRFT